MRILKIENKNQNRKWIFSFQVLNKPRKFWLLHIETENQNGKRIYPNQVLNKPRKFWLFRNWNGKPKRKKNLSKSRFQQTEKAPAFYKLKRKTKTESELFQFKISTNRESSDFLQIETENQNGKKIIPIQVLNKQNKTKH